MIKHLLNILIMLTDMQFGILFTEPLELAKAE